MEYFIESVVMLLVFILCGKEYLSWYIVKSSASDEYKKEGFNVSEPILTFVELVKNNPKRFWVGEEVVFKQRLVQDYDGYPEVEDFPYQRFTLVDKELNVCYCFGKYLKEGRLSLDYNFNPEKEAYRDNVKLENVQNLSWVTESEWKYINKHLIQGVYWKRRDRYREILRLRKERRSNALKSEIQKEKDMQRQKIKDLYIKQEK